LTLNELLVVSLDRLGDGIDLAVESCKSVAVGISE
jgi:hypothetical protein